MHAPFLFLQRTGFGLDEVGPVVVLAGVSDAILAGGGGGGGGGGRAEDLDKEEKVTSL